MMILMVTTFMLCLTLYKGAVWAESFGLYIHGNIPQNVTGPSCLHERVIEIAIHGIRVCCLHNHCGTIFYNNFITGIIQRRCNGFQSCDITEQDSRLISEHAMKEDKTCIEFKVGLFYVCKEIKELNNICNSARTITYTTASIFLYSPDYPYTIKNQQQFCRCIIEPPIRISIVTVYIDMQFAADRDNEDMLTFTWANNSAITFDDEKRQDDVYDGILQEISLTTHLFPQHHPHGKVLLQLTKKSDGWFQIQCSDTFEPSKLTTYSPVSTAKPLDSKTTQTTSIISTPNSGHEHNDTDDTDIYRAIMIGGVVNGVLLLGLLIAFVIVMIYRRRISHGRQTSTTGEQNTPENHQYYNVGANNETQGEYENVDSFRMQHTQVANSSALRPDSTYTVNDPTSLQRSPNEYEQLDGNQVNTLSDMMHYSEQDNPQLETLT